MKKLFVILLGVISTIIVLPLAYNNSQPVDFNYFFGSYQLPLAWLTFGSFILGVLLAIIFFAISGLGWKLRAKSLNRQVDELLKQRKRDEIKDQFQAEKKISAKQTNEKTA